MKTRFSKNSESEADLFADKLYFRQVQPLSPDGHFFYYSLMNKIDSYHVIMFKNIILLSVLPLVLTSYSLNNCLFLMKLQSYQIILLTKFLHVPTYFLMNSHEGNYQFASSASLIVFVFSNQNIREANFDKYQSG